MKSIIWLVLIALGLSSAENYVFNPDGLLVEKSVDFIENISSELYAKTGVRLYVIAVDTLQGEKEKKVLRKEFKQEHLSKLQSPYAVIFFIKSHRKIDLILEPKIKSIHADSIITDYMVPILIQDKELPPSKISAAILNGYAQLADEIADHFHQSLPENIIVDRSGVKDFVHYSIYAMLGGMFGLIALIYIFRRRE